ncbi:hypothetical protein [Peribacillus simplex]|uniref:hypothetical protein n=1 Tax=Peribacillus simplex TaxID=1478 RepID=UPI0024C12A0F|nr:hypothetical protein [Peribacillus simplex]WHY99441.1 hypothetical protein QNH37_09965 [Peribacillus simplex]
MNHWEILYHSRTHSVSDAISRIRPNQNIFLSGYCNEPQTLVEELVNQKERLKGSALYINVAGSPLLYEVPYFQIRTFLSTSGLKNVMEKGNCD